MSVILLDTSAYSAFKRGNDDIIHIVQRATGILLPTVVIGELLAGFEVGNRTEWNHRELQAFTESPRVRIAPLTYASAERYAHIYAYLHSVGRPVPTNDLWIAACAMEHGAELITGDGHFEHMPQVVVRLIKAE